MSAEQSNETLKKCIHVEIEAFHRDLVEATKKPLKANGHATWIKAINDLSRILSKHMPVDLPEDLPLDVPMETAEITQLEDFRGKFNLG